MRVDLLQGLQVMHQTFWPGLRELRAVTARVTHLLSQGASQDPYRGIAPQGTHSIDGSVQHLQRIYNKRGRVIFTHIFIPGPLHTHTYG